MQADLHPTSRIADRALVKGRGLLKLGPYSVIEENALIDLGDRPDAALILGVRSKLKYGTVVRCFGGRIDISSRCTIGEYNYIGGHGGVVIEADVITAMHCVINAAGHIFEGTSPIRFQGETARGIRIGKGAWIGAHSSVLDAVTIGSGAIVAANSAVVRDLPADTVCAGAPCRIIRHLKRGVPNVGAN